MPAGYLLLLVSVAVGGSMLAKGWPRLVTFSVGPFLPLALVLVDVPAFPLVVVVGVPAMESLRRCIWSPGSSVLSGVVTGLGFFGLPADPSHQQGH